MKILIAGGSGLIGSYLTTYLIEKGHEIAHLSRSGGRSSVKTYLWDPLHKYLDAESISNSDFIINLAGAGIADKRWDASYKNELYNSRIGGTAFLFEKLKEIPNNVKGVVSASAAGFYGNINNETAYEEMANSHDFLGKMCFDWEKESEKIKSLNKRVIILRFAGMVLSSKGGGLPKMALPVKYFFGSPVCNGKHFTSWVHIEDVCRFIDNAISDIKIEGTFNLVAPQHVTNKEMTKLLGKVLNRPVIIPYGPMIILKCMFGEFGNYLNHSAKLSSKKILETGFTFKYNDIEQALRAIYL